MGGLKRQSVGIKWEQEIIDAYYKKGWQPFKIPTEIKGTCFDIILIKNSIVMCIEAKHITGEKLYFKSSGLDKKQDELNTLKDIKDEVEALLSLSNDLDYQEEVLTRYNIITKKTKKISE